MRVSRGNPNILPQSVHTAGYQFDANSPNRSIQLRDKSNEENKLLICPRAYSN